MYQSYWGLNARPFDQRADAAFYYPAEGHQAAIVKLRYALENGAAAALAGAAGTGKTLLLTTLERQLGQRGFVFARLSYPLLSPRELLAYLADELAPERSSLNSPAPPLDQCLRRIENELDRLAAQQKRPVIAVDEAQVIDNPHMFEALRLLLNLESSNRPGPALLLVGQTRLLTTLARAPSLQERFMAICLLPLLGSGETAAYIAHRLQAAGRMQELFDASAIEAIHAYAQGTPRRINRLCDLALVVGYAEERQSISAEQIEAVAEELTGITRAASEMPSDRLTAAARE
jgi:general secretion pathway protein A